MSIRILLLSILLLVLGYGGVATGAEKVVAVQSYNIRPYDEALKGFRGSCDCRVQSLVLSRLEDKDVVRAIRREGPDLILAIGMEALLAMREIRDIPIVYVMVLNPQPILSNAANITGVTMRVSPESQLAMLRKVLPQARNVGILYSAEGSGPFIRQARTAAKELGLGIVASEAGSPREVPTLLQAMRKEIDVFWMIPDLRVITPETVEFFFQFSIENRIPLLSFSSKYVEKGALFSVETDAADMGRTAGEMAKKILSGKDVRDVRPLDGSKAEVTVNSHVAKKLGIPLSDEVLRRARVIGQD